MTEPSTDERGRRAHSIVNVTHRGILGGWNNHCSCGTTIIEPEGGDERVKAHLAGPPSPLLVRGTYRNGYRDGYTAGRAAARPAVDVECRDAIFNIIASGLSTAARATLCEEDLLAIVNALVEHFAVDVEALAVWLDRHQPVTRVDTGRIVGCQCLDRVFYAEHESWGAHLAQAVVAYLAGEGR